MPRPKLSLPHERRKLALRSQKMRSQVRIAEEKQRIETIARSRGLSNEAGQQLLDTVITEMQAQDTARTAASLAAAT